MLPAGPSVLDEVANGAFWFGLMQALAARQIDVSRQMDFDQARGELLTAAREGLWRPLHVARR